MPGGGGGGRWCSAERNKEREGGWCTASRNKEGERGNIILRERERCNAERKRVVYSQ